MASASARRCAARATGCPPPLILRPGLLYVVTLEQCDIYTSSEKEPKPSSGFRGTGGEQIPAEPGQFYLRAFEAPTGRLRWEYKMTGPATMWAGSGRPGFAHWQRPVALLHRPPIVCVANDVSSERPAVRDNRGRKRYLHVRTPANRRRSGVLATCLRGYKQIAGATYALARSAAIRHKRVRC